MSASFWGNSPHCHPTQGYPSKRAAAIALAGLGLTTSEIAARIGSTVGSVKSYRSQERRRVADRAPDATACGLFLDNALANALRPHAARRGLTVTTLAHRLLEAVVEDGLICAVLDDAEAARDRRGAGPGRRPAVRS